MARPTDVLKSFLVGRPKATEGLEHERLTKKVGLAVFASDALSSSAYATEEMLVVLITAGTTALVYSVPISLAITAVLGIVIFSYRQTIHAYPDGASAYIVASKNLGKYPGLVAASALLIDYVLTVAVSITAGTDAIVSLVPDLNRYRVLIAIGVIVIITLLNLRGVRESGVIFAVPTYAYIILISSLVIVGLLRYAGGYRPDVAETHVATQGALTFFLLLRAYSHGSTALTGVEAVSDGVQAFRKPVARNAAITLVVMGVLLGFLFVGITVLARLYDITGPTHEPRRTVIALIALAVFGEGSPLFYAIQLATFMILFLAANTSYSDFPRLANFLARDRYAPRQFMNRGDRLAFSNGIVALGALAAVMVVIYQAELSRIINLYVVGVFTSFTLSQSGMVQHWRRRRSEEPRWRRSAFINGLGAFTTFLVLCIVLATKFTHGAYIVVAAVPVLVWTLNRINTHYREVGRQLRLPERRPADDGQNHVILLVGRPTTEETRAFWYAERIRTEDFHPVHFAERGDPKGIEAQWTRMIGLLATAPTLEVQPTSGMLTTSIRAYIERMRLRIPTSDFITVIVSERVRSGRFLNLGTRTGLLIKVALLFTPDIVVTNVPFVESDEQTSLDRGVPVRHVVVVLVSAAHNATLHAVAYAKTLSSDEVHAVHIALDPEESKRHLREWNELNIDLPLEIVDSPYRELGDPVRDYVRSITEDGNTIVTLVLAEFVVKKWWHRALHNQNAFELKLLFLPEPDVIVTSVPYHLE